MKITLLDGGSGDEIQRRLSRSPNGLWSAQALIEEPDVVVDVHQAFIAAGAQIITTNTYSTIPSYLGKAGIADKYIQLTRFGGELARKAVDESDSSVLVAGSIPPLSESYRADLVPPANESLPIYQDLVVALQNYVDMYFCETMSSIAESLNAATQAIQFGQGKPVYVSWTLNESPGSGLRSGESVTAAFEALSQLNVAGFMFNCSFPEAIEPAMLEIRMLTDKPLGCYPNRSKRIAKDWTLDSDVDIGVRSGFSTDDFVATSLRCIDLGATMVGGCCEVGPEYIKALATASKHLR